MNMQDARKQSKKHIPEAKLSFSENIRFLAIKIRILIAKIIGKKSVLVTFDCMVTMPEEVDKYVRLLESKGYTVRLITTLDSYFDAQAFLTHLEEFGTADMFVSWRSIN